MLTAHDGIKLKLISCFPQNVANADGEVECQIMESGTVYLKLDSIFGDCA